MAPSLILRLRHEQDPGQQTNEKLIIYPHNPCTSVPGAPVDVRHPGPVREARCAAAREPPMDVRHPRSHEQQVPFSRQTSTVLAREGRGGALLAPGTGQPRAADGAARPDLPHPSRNPTRPARRYGRARRPASPLQEPQDPGQLTTRLDHPGLIGGHEPVIAQLTVLNPHAIRLEEVDAA